MSGNGSAARDFEACLVMDVDHLLGIPWVEGGRDFRPFQGGTDCLGIVLHVVRDVLGIPVADPWERLAERWEDGRFAIWPEHFPEGWRQVAEPFHRGDVSVTGRGFHLAVYIGGGWWLSSRQYVGTHKIESRRTTVESAMRWVGASA